MTDLTPFDFDGLDESAFGFHPDHGPLVHKSKFFAWIGYDTTNNSRTEGRHLGAKDLVKGVFSPIGGGKRGGRRADALTERGVQRILLRSDHPRAVEYTDQVLDLLASLKRDGMVVDEQRITDEQIAAGKERLDSIAQRRLEERRDYKVILHALKLGGAVSDDYRHVQNSLYVRLFGHTAAAIRERREIRTWDGKNGPTKADLKVAKNYLTEPELKLLNNTVLGVFTQIDQHYPDGASAGQMVDAIERAAALTLPRRAA